MMTILTSSSWTTFLDCVGSMKTSWLLPHTPLWVSHYLAHLHNSIDTTMDGKLQAWLLPHTPLWVSHSSSCSTWTCTLQTWWRSLLDVILHGLYEIFLLTQDHGNIPNPTKNSHVDHGLVHKAWWTMLTIPWDHLIPLGTSSTLCGLINLIHSLT